MMSIRKILLTRWLLIAFLAGVLWAGFFGGVIWVFFLASSAVLIMNMVFWHKRLFLLSVGIVLLFTSGLIRMHWSQSRLPQLPPGLVGTQVDFRGTVLVVIPTTRGYRVLAEGARSDGYEARLSETEEPEMGVPDDRYILSVSLPVDTLVREGNSIQLRGVIDIPQDFDTSFSWKSYLQRQGVAGVMEYPEVSILSRDASWFSSWRLLLLQRLQLLFPHISGSLMGGLILGARASFSKIFLEQLQISGLTHIVAVSGFNISLIIVFMAGFVFRKTRRSLRFWSVSLLVISFVLLAGPSASVVRAAIMGGMGLLASVAGRKANALNMILWASVAMLVYNPLLVFDVGFQLSFLATLGIILFFPFVEKLPLTNRYLRMIVQGFCLTLAAEILLLPVLLYQFGSFSLIAPLSNLLILWSVPVVMLLGMVALFLSFIPIVSLLAPTVGYLGFLGTKFIEWGVVFSAQLPFAQIQIDSARWEWVVVWYVFITVVYFWGWKRILDARR